jgi:carbon storage regulator
MLILTRREGETIIINDNIRVTVLGIEGRGARLGIDAPPEIPVDREEIHRAKNLRLEEAKDENL